MLIIFDPMSYSHSSKYKKQTYYIFFCLKLFNLLLRIFLIIQPKNMLSILQPGTSKYYILATLNSNNSKFSCWLCPKSWSCHPNVKPKTENEQKINDWTMKIFVYPFCYKFLKAWYFCLQKGAWVNDRSNQHGITHSEKWNLLAT